MILLIYMEDPPYFHLVEALGVGYLLLVARVRSISGQGYKFWESFWEDLY